MRGIGPIEIKIDVIYSKRNDNKVMKQTSYIYWKFKLLLCWQSRVPPWGDSFDHGDDNSTQNAENSRPKYYLFEKVWKISNLCRNVRRLSKKCMTIHRHRLNVHNKTLSSFEFQRNKNRSHLLHKKIKKLILYIIYIIY